MTKTETKRIWHSDGSCTDVIIRTTERQGFWGPTIHQDIQKIHHTREELEAQAEAGATAAGILIVGGLVYAGFKALFSSKDSKK